MLIVLFYLLQKNIHLGTTLDLFVVIYAIKETNFKKISEEAFLGNDFKLMKNKFSTKVDYFEVAMLTQR